MKSFIQIILCGILLLFITPLAHAEKNSPSLIESFEGDITGDGFREKINLHGKLLNNNSVFYQNVWIDITNEFKRDWSIVLQNGYHPKIKLLDLNHDKVPDLFYQIARNEKEQHFHYQLYTIKNGMVKQLPLPDRLYSKGEFVDGFKVSLQLSPNEQPIIIDISTHKENYIKEQLYDEAGKLTRNKRTIIDPITILESQLISESKGYGLKSLQRVYGLNQKDLLGSIETVWYYTNDKWIVLKGDFLPGT